MAANADSGDGSPRHPAPAVPTYACGRWLCLRLLGVIYLLAYGSLGLQVLSLWGSRGLLPAGDAFSGARNPAWSSTYWVNPTLFRFAHTDGALQSGCWLGMCLAVLLILNVAPKICAAALWILYLSFVDMDDVFLVCPWDYLLLEVGLLSIFLAPWSFRPCRAPLTPPSAMVAFVFRLFLMYMNLESGLGKLFSPDPAWRHLRAMDFYYERTPLPTLPGWFLFHLPAAWHAFETLATLVIQCVIPFFILGSPFWRRMAFLPLAVLQAMIALSANFGFFNYLSAFVLVMLLDDEFFVFWIPKLRGKIRESMPLARKEIRWGGSLLIVLWSFLTWTGYVEISRNLWTGRGGSPLFCRMADGILAVSKPIKYLTAPFHPVHSNVLFTVTQSARYEMEIEGSEEGIDWRPYEFASKPGNPTRRPQSCGPHLPRVEFRLFYTMLPVAPPKEFEEMLANPDYFKTLMVIYPFLEPLLTAILRGSPIVNELFAENPFPDHPPTHVRVMVYRYSIASMETWRKQGIWWDRELITQWGPILLPRR